MDLSPEAFCIDGDCRLIKPLQDEYSESKLNTPKIVQDLAHQTEFHQFFLLFEVKTVVPT